MRKIALLILIPFLVGCTSQALSPVTQLPQTEQSRQAQSTHSAGGTFTPIDNPNGVNGTIPWGINPQGAIVGNYYDSQSVMHGFLLRDGVYTAIEDPNAGNGFGQGTQPTGINASGEIVGGYVDNANNLHGFTFRSGRFTTFDDPVGIGTDMHAISANGDIIGDYYDSAFGIHGFLFDGHKFTTIDAPGAPQGQAHCGTDMGGINPSGDIVMWTRCDTDPTFVNAGFLLHDGKFTSIDDPSALGEGTLAFGISPQGIVVGSYNANNYSAAFGFILCDGVYTTLNSPVNVFGDQLNGISPSGDIVGLSLDVNSDFTAIIPHGFLYHPVSGARRGNCGEGDMTANSASQTARTPMQAEYRGFKVHVKDRIL